MNEAILEVISVTVQRLSDACYSISVIEKYQTVYNSLIRFCEFSCIKVYSPEVGKTFLHYYREQHPTVSKENMSAYCTGIKHLDCTFLNTEMNRGPFGRPPQPYEDSCFNDIRDRYKIYLEETGKMPKDVRSRMLCVSRFLKFAESQGIKTLSELTGADIHTAFKQATDKGRFRRLVGHFLTFVHKYGLTEQNLYLSIPHSTRHKAIPSVFSTDEVERIIASIDRGTKIGKRNYAIVLIAARLGLRASDIAGLTFNSVLIQEKKIKIEHQQKTRLPLTLPLLDEVRDAIDDYVRYARQPSEDKHVFLNIANNDSITPSNIGKIVELSITASGINTKNKRKGSHSLRSSLATALLEEGNSYATVQQILGHDSIQSTKAYVEVSVEQLRIYAMPVPAPSGYFQKFLAQEVAL